MKTLGTAKKWPLHATGEPERMAGMGNDEEIIGLLRDIVENQRKSLAARKRAFRFVNWTSVVALAAVLVLLYFTFHPAK
jgi:hypothetical protein